MENTFTMSTLKAGRIKYLLLTMIPALIVMYLFTLLASVGILPEGKIFGLVYTCVSMCLMMTLAYFLIFKKNHLIEFTENEIRHRDWRGRTSVIPICLVHAYQRNWLKEYILLDETGRKLVCVEANMDHFDLFEQWITKKHFTKWNKEK